MFMKIISSLEISDDNTITCSSFASSMVFLGGGFEGRGGGVLNIAHLFVFLSFGNVVRIITTTNKE